MKCDRLHAVIRVSQCLANQKWQSTMGTNHKPGRPSCWGCPTGEAVRKGELNDDDVEAMKQRILDGMRASGEQRKTGSNFRTGSMNLPAERETTAMELNTGVTMEMKQKAKARASEVMEQRKCNDALESVDNGLKQVSQAEEMVPADGSASMSPDSRQEEKDPNENQAPGNGNGNGSSPSENAMSTCEQCGTSFEKYKRGSIMVTRICLPCLNAKIGKANSGPMQPRTAPPQAEEASVIQNTAPARDNWVVSLDFTAYPELLRALTSSAVDDFREPSMQALFLLKQALEDHHATS